MPWRDLHDAPRDKAVWLFLPAAKYTARADGTVADVQHEVVLAQWRGDQSTWMAGNRHVYPSLWSDADPTGDAPEQPVLA